MGKPEAKNEDYLVKRAKLVGAEIRKVVWVAHRGAPDRFILTAGANTVNFWAEVKRDGGVAEEHQAREHARMRERGEIVLVLNSHAAIDAALPLPR